MDKNDQAKQQPPDLPQVEDLKRCIRQVHHNAKKTGSYVAALVVIGNIAPLFAAFLSVLLYIFLFILFPSRPPWLALSAIGGGSLFVLLCWLLIALLCKRFTAVDRANPARYEQLLNRLQQIVAWYGACLLKKPECNHLYAIGMREIAESFDKICEELEASGSSWISAMGYMNAWKLCTASRKLS